MVGKATECPNSVFGVIISPSVALLKVMKVIMQRGGKDLMVKNYKILLY